MEAKNDIETLKHFLKHPLNSGDSILAAFAGLEGAIHRGSGLKQFVYIEGSRKDKVVLIAHADTYWDNHYEIETIVNHKLKQRGNIISSGSPGFGIGADDRAGCAILWLLKDSGHSLLITNGEEHGRKGSKWLMEKNGDIARRINNEHQFMMQLDRRNGADFKCYNVGTDAFREYVEDKTGFEEPNTSSFTDIVTLCENIPGVNLSIGYYDEHSEEETLNVEEWLKTLNICRNWLKETDLPGFLLDLTTAVA